MELNACKPGMRVALAEDYSYGKTLRSKGDLAEIIRIEHDLIFVRFEDGTVGTWNPHWFNPAPESPFKAGDRVKLGRNYPPEAHPANGHAGKVLDVVGSTVFVLFDNGVTDEFGADVLEHVEEPPKPNYVEEMLVRVVKEGDRWYNALGVIWSIDERNEHPYRVSMHLQPGSYADAGEGARYAAEELVPWVPTQADADAVRDHWLRLGFTFIHTPVRGFEPFTAWFEEQKPYMKQVNRARAKREASIGGHLPYIRVGRYTLRVDAIRVVEETDLGLWVTDFEQAGAPDYTDNRGILIVDEDAKRLRSWLDDLTYDLAGEDYKASTGE